MRTSSEAAETAVTVEALAGAKLIPVKFLYELGLADTARGVIIPYGDGARIRVRSTVSAKGSIWDSSDRAIVPYGLFRAEISKARDRGFLIVVEGESDCWALWHHGYPALGLPGATMVGVIEAKHLAGIGSIFVVREPGTAGAGFPCRVADRVDQMKYSSRPTESGVGLPVVYEIAMPSGIKDPAELHLHVGGDNDRFATAMEQAFGQAVPAHSADNANSAIVHWAPPNPIYDFDRPPFPTHVLPDWLKEFVEAEAVATQTPPDLATMLSLSAVAASTARRVEVEVKEGWREPLNIYTVTVLPSGSRKSAVFRDVITPLEAEEERVALAARNDLAVAQEEKGFLERKLTQTRKDVDSGDATLEEVQHLAAELAKFEVLAVPRLLADDVTSEKLEILLAEQGGRMAVFAAEADVFDVMSGRYSASRVINLGVFLKGHSGDSIRVDRVGRGTVIVHCPSLTVGLAVQPDVIDGLAARREFRGRGLTPRFLYSLPTSNVGRRDVDPPPLPRAIRSTYEANLTRLLELRSAEEGDDYRPHVLYLDKEARTALHRFAAQIELELMPTGELGGIIEWGSKLVGAVARIAGNLHIADHAAEDEPWGKPVTADAVERAIEIGRYLIPHAQAAFALMGADPAITDAEHILKWIEGKAKTEFTVRELFEGVKGSFKKVDNLKRGMDLLVDHDYIRKRDQLRPTGPGRPPSPTFDVNPAVQSQYSQNPQIRP